MNHKTYEATAPRTVAFIGLGVMGHPMAGHLARAGHRVTVHNRSAAKAAAWAAEYGGTAAATPLTVGERLPLAGTPREIAEELRRFAAEGISEVQVSPTVDGLAGIELMAPVLERLRNTPSA